MLPCIRYEQKARELGLCLRIRENEHTGVGPLFLICCLLDAVSVRHTKAFIHAPLGHIHDSRSRRTDYPLGLIQLMRALHKFHVPCNNARVRALCHHKHPKFGEMRWAYCVLCVLLASVLCGIAGGWAKSGWQSLVMCEMCGFNIIYVYSYAWHDDTHDIKATPVRRSEMMCTQ